MVRTAIWRLEMKYIPQSLEVASQWVDVCQLCMGIDHSEVASMYANMCGFGSWDLMATHMIVERPSLTDEEIKEEEMDIRHCFYREVLVDTFFMNPCFADYLIAMVSPSSGKPCVPFSVDRARIFTRSSSGLHISGRHMGRAINAYAEQVLGPKLGKSFDFSNFSDRLRVHSGVFPGYWYNLMDSLGWDIQGHTYAEEYVFGRPSVFVSSKNNDSIPIYIVSLSRIPLEGSDQMANAVLDCLESDFTSRLMLDKAIVFWGSMLSKRVEGRWFTHPGMVYQSGVWKEFLINQHVKSIDMAFDMVRVMDINDPHPLFEDFQMELNRGFSYMKMDVDCPTKVEFNQLTNPSGWINLIPNLRKD
jgi:hypothetical protein